jgi:hypothetical protein
MRTLTQINKALQKRGAIGDFYGNDVKEGFLCSALDKAPDDNYDQWLNWLQKDNFEDKEWRDFVRQEGDIFIAWWDTRKIHLATVLGWI